MRSYECVYDDADRRRQQIRTDGQAMSWMGLRETTQKSPAVSFAEVHLQTQINTNNRATAEEATTKERSANCLQLMTRERDVVTILLLSWKSKPHCLLKIAVNSELNVLD